MEGGCTASRRLDRWPGAALLESAVSQGFRGRSLDSNDPFEVIDPSSDRIEFIEVIDSTDRSLPQDPRTSCAGPGDSAPITRDSRDRLFS